MPLGNCETGLPVQVQGSYNAQNQLVADAVKFKGSNLKNPEDIQAGINPTEQQARRTSSKSSKASSHGSRL
jgi:OOP family OmpA-OmpF porin